ncbi:GGDEF domain protein [Oxobacter pfennigii]|uniref:GGDEF domain protein n=1 Tax=Oxobacter pfennigii TaxID=36849 RepID=A0A0P8YZH2_9CLOT|nr:diguanylate cyclase [Oxobacter pfennigii]KPU45258.1 GGDEF domain protein [Oxobacter pfennigii]
MEERHNKLISRRIDLAVTLVITMFFVLIITFSYGEFNKSMTNVFIILFVMIGAVVGYYTNITAAIFYSIIFNFLYASINIYLNLANIYNIGFEIYFWMVAVPLFSIIFAYKGKILKEIQSENCALKKENEELVMIDKETQLRGSQTFFDELQSYMNISNRYGIEVYLMLIKIKYHNEIIRVLGEAKYKKIINRISQIIDSVLREEDRKYILRNMDMFGIIFLSNKDGGKYVEKRLKEAICSTEFKEDYLINRIKLEIITGIVIYDKNIINNPYDFFRMAEKDMEYDV